MYYLATENVRLGIPLDDGTIDYVFQLRPKVPGSKARPSLPCTWYSTPTSQLSNVPSALPAGDTLCCCMTKWRYSITYTAAGHSCDNDLISRLLHWLALPLGS